jgi:YegS/Rv2252/BmrU family lipid kinase
MARVVSIVNPVAGKAKGAKLRAKAVEELKRLFPDIAFHESNAPGHATVLAQAAKDVELIIAVGGDGTVREVVCGLMSATGPLDHLTTRPLLAVVPVGSCNDLPRNIGIPADIIQACRVAKEGRARPIDVIRVEMSRDGNTQQTFFANAAGFGFDAQVTTEAQKSKRLRGMPLYLVAIVRTLRHLECPLVRIRAGDFAAEQRVLMVAAANGQYYGGGLKVAPDARPDDGFIDVCIGWEMGWWSTLKKLPRFVAGTHVRLKEVRMLRIPELELEFLEPVKIELDGDVLVPQPFNHFRLNVLPGAVRVRVASR